MGQYKSAEKIKEYMLFRFFKYFNTSINLGQWYPITPNSPKTSIRTK